MFAVIRSGGKQYRVVENDVISVDRLEGEVGAKIALSEVLMLGGDQPKHGSPLVSGASVEAEIVEHGRGPKTIAFKKKRRKNTHRKRGGRSHLTTVKITGISAGA
ncbi:MAG TPA: 50S ribosomal protein L21 [Rhizomicrobium sp.]|nr:50S ribosomal protein L21 [Rhizomicrobium sp.]